MKTMAMLRETLVLGLAGFCGCGTVADSGSGDSPAPANVAKSDESVERALGWIVKNQQPDGRWMSNLGIDFGPGSTTVFGVHDIGVTGLALLALQESGHQPGHGAYANAVKNGLEYLKKVQDPNLGCFGEVNSHQAFLYDHALATRAMVRAYAVTKDAELKASAEAGKKFIEAARNPYKAWRYSYPPNGDNDVSMTGFMILTLADAKAAGMSVDPNAEEGARIFIDEMTDASTGRTGYIQRGGYSAREPGTTERWPAPMTEAMTAVALSCRQAIGSSAANAEAIAKGSALLNALPPRWSDEGHVDYFYWYFGTRALNEQGAEKAAAWNAALQSALIEHQEKDGSFDPLDDPWGRSGGAVYATAINALALQGASSR